jgi:hypothetical protein
VTHPVRPLALPMRVLLYTASFLVLGAGIPLFLLSEQTATWFAWTIDPPLTAATLRAAYWAATALEFTAARARSWAEARIALPGVLVFTTLMNLPVLQNIEAYDFDNPAAWVWVAVYATVPFLLLGALVHQLRQPGGPPPASEPLPTWIRVALAGHGALFLTMGALLLLAPELAGSWWPWDLDPVESAYGGQTEPYFGCWGLGLGLVAAQAAWENDLARLRPAFPAYLTLGAFQLLALGRYPETLDWAGPASWIWLGVLISVMAVGLAGALAVRKLGQD